MTSKEIESEETSNPRRGREGQPENREIDSNNAECRES
jgi:hypothetical protein